MRTAILPKPEQVFRALSDKTRLRILNLLLQGELCVCDIISVLDIPQPTASRHLAYLRKAGLVRGRKEGVWRHYSLASAGTHFEKCLRRCLESCAATMPRLQIDRTKLARADTKCCE